MDDGCASALAMSKCLPPCRSAGGDAMALNTQCGSVNQDPDSRQLAVRRTCRTLLLVGLVCFLVCCYNNAVADIRIRYISSVTTRHSNAHTDAHNKCTTAAKRRDPTMALCARDKLYQVTQGYFSFSVKCCWSLLFIHLVGRALFVATF
jgi:hypothetical protein